jgi:pentatricopeptide repeat protein
MFCNCISWNVCLRGVLGHNQVERACHLFDEMHVRETSREQLCQVGSGRQRWAGQRRCTVMLVVVLVGFGLYGAMTLNKKSRKSSELVTVFLICMLHTWQHSTIRGRKTPTLQSDLIQDFLKEIKGYFPSQPIHDLKCIINRKMGKKMFFK